MSIAMKMCAEDADKPFEAFTVDEVASSLHVTTKTVRRLIWKGELGSIHVGRAVRVTRRQLADYVEGGAQ